MRTWILTTKSLTGVPRVTGGSEEDRGGILSHCSRCFLGISSLCHAVAMVMLSFLGGCWLYIYFRTCQYYPSFDFSNPFFRNILARLIEMLLQMHESF